MLNKKYFSKLLLFTLSLFIIISPVFVLAEETRVGSSPGETRVGSAPAPSPPIKYSIKINNPFKSNNLVDLLKAIVKDILIPIGSVVATIMVIYAGFLFVTAQGNSAQIEKAKNALLYALIGAAILLGAWVITDAISATIDKLRS